MLELFGLVFGFYIFCAISIYTYSVLKSYSITGNWYFNVKDGYVGICKYPKFTLFWLEYIICKLRK